jgi:hypothetical protein
MRIAFIALFTLSFSLIFAQSKIPTNSDGKAEYVAVKEVPSTVPAELFARGLNWVKDYYKNPSTTIQSQKAGEEIVLKSRLRLTETDKKGNVTPSGYMNYTMTIQFKDGKYRYVIGKIYMSASSYFDVSKWEQTEGTGYDAKRYPGYVTQTTAYFDRLLDSFTKGMLKPSVVEKSDW